MNACRPGVEMLLLVAESASDERDPEHQQQVAEDRTDQRCLDDEKVVRPDQQDAYDELGDVAERGTMARPAVMKTKTGRPSRSATIDTGTNTSSQSIDGFESRATRLLIASTLQ